VTNVNEHFVQLNIQILQGSAAEDLGDVTDFIPAFSAVSAVHLRMQD